MSRNQRFAVVYIALLLFVSIAWKIGRDHYNEDAVARRMGWDSAASRHYGCNVRDQTPDGECY